MCILCVIQKWSRRVATMLPWLVLPLIGLWALSQLLPPAFRFEITSPRLACVFVLLVTLFWYEILMPQLSAWRVRRNARLRERKRFEAMALQKLRKTATRKCRNCFTPYKDQNPGGGKFMCSYCGHISKRPVLDLPVPPGLGMSGSGIIKDLVGKGGKLLNGKEWADSGWMCSQDWLDSGNWGGGPNHWKNCEHGVHGGNDDCVSDKSYLSSLIFAVKLFTSFLTSIRWLCRKIFRLSSSGEDPSSSEEHGGMLAKRGENGGNFHESRGEKARRKAEEKRQARLEKELLEEEERKQREEVARLVEERRKLRDERSEAEKDRTNSSLLAKEKSSKKEAEKKRQERRKEKDKGSSKSNSDVEELDKKAGKESERKRDLDKKNETDRKDHQKTVLERAKLHSVESRQALKNNTATNFGRGNAGTRYLDRVRGTFMSSSRAFSGSGFFGRAPQTHASVAKENKFNGSVDAHSSGHRKDLFLPEHLAGKVNTSADDRNNHPVISDTQPRTMQKKSWHDLFRGSSSTPTSSNASVISRPNPKLQAEGQGLPFSGQTSSIQSYDNPIDFGSPFTLSTDPSIPASSSLGFSPHIGPIFPRATQVPCEYIPEESEHFEDPCYIPDPMSLLGPVSESLDNFESDAGMARSHVLKNISASPEVTKPSPIESPLSRLQIADEKQYGANWLPNNASQGAHTLSASNEKGTWQMWNSSPLGQDLIHGPGSWFLSQDRIIPTKEDILHPSSQLFPKDDQLLHDTHSPRKTLFGNGQNGIVFSKVTGSNGADPWLQKALYPPALSNDNNFPLKPLEEGAQNELIYGSPGTAAINHPFEPQPPVHNWPQIERPVQGSVGDGMGKSPVGRPGIGGLFPTPDVQSLWSFESK